MVILLQVLRIITAPFDLQRKNYYVTKCSIHIPTYYTLPLETQLQNDAFVCAFYTFRCC